MQDEYAQRACPRRRVDVDYRPSRRMSQHNVSDIVREVIRQPKVDRVMRTREERCGRRPERGRISSWGRSYESRGSASLACGSLWFSDGQSQQRQFVRLDFTLKFSIVPTGTQREGLREAATH